MCVSMYIYIEREREWKVQCKECKCVAIFEWYGYKKESNRKRIKGDGVKLSWDINKFDSVFKDDTQLSESPTTGFAFACLLATFTMDMGESLSLLVGYLEKLNIYVQTYSK